MDLIENLIKDGWLKTPGIVEAFKMVKRADFIPEGMKNLAELDEALPIGYGQTISQPLTVAFMLEQLQPQVGDKVLDVGFGSGWTSALLGEIVGQRGKVIAIELVPELKEFGEKNAEKYNRGQVHFILGDGSKGYEKEAPFDKILSSAAVQNEIPKDWKKQLKIGGRIVTSIRSSIWLLVKRSKTEFKETEYPGFAFVPLVEK
ncbi:MAG: protein-L-isoaspartate O-methyltransferase [Candidatus Nealsonbacteria bacterium]|nr:protein-L-isoaspartate O-methyltransferase [Candidatus Nealsonbacteria bacterium]